MTEPDTRLSSRLSADSDIHVQLYSPWDNGLSTLLPHVRLCSPPVCWRPLLYCPSWFCCDKLWQVKICLANDLKEAMEIAQDHAEKGQYRHAQLYNRKVKGSNINVVDRVLMEVERSSGIHSPCGINLTNCRGILCFLQDYRDSCVMVFYRVVVYRSRLGQWSVYRWVWNSISSGLEVRSDRKILRWGCVPLRQQALLSVGYSQRKPLHAWCWTSVSVSPPILLNPLIPPDT